MKVLIIGAKGMLGQELTREFGEHGDEVVSWDKEEIDITNREQVMQKIKSLSKSPSISPFQKGGGVAGPEIIINAAAYNAVDKIEEGEKDLADEVNGYAVGTLSEGAEAVDAIFIHYSTDYVFDGKEIDGYKEDDKPNPQSVYAYSKWLGEQILTNKNFQFPISNFQANPKSKISNVKYYLIRTSRLFGKSAISEGAKKSFVDVMLGCAQEKDCLELVDEEFSSPTYVCDLAKRTREIVEWEKPFGTYHVANVGGCTWYGWAKKIFEISGKNIKLVPVGTDKFPRPAKRPKYSILLNTKLPPMRKWEDALAEYLKIR